MTAQSDNRRMANRIGSLWMVASMAAFAVEDALIKGASQTLPIGQILILFGIGGALVFAGLNLMWILCLGWALVGYLPALLLSGALHHLITLRFHRP